VSPDQSSATELVHGQAGAEEAEAEDNATRGPVAVNEVLIADPEQHCGDQADWDGEQKVSPSRWPFGLGWRRLLGAPGHIGSMPLRFWEPGPS
jgi:hypothetical protein